MRGRFITVILAAAGIALAAVIVFRVEPALRGHLKALETIQRLGIVSSSRSLLLMRARYNLLDNYDPINASTQSFDLILEDLLEEQKSFQDREPTLQTATARALGEVRRVEETIEDFKSSAAILRNSLANLPALLEDSRARPTKEGADGAHAAVADGLVVGLVQALIQFALDGTPEAEERVTSLRRILTADNGGPRFPDGPPLLANTELVLRYRRRTDALLQTVLTAPLDQRFQDLAGWHSDQLRSIGRQRTTMDAALLTVGCGLILIIARLILAQHRSRTLLEVRVADRTRDLATLNESLRQANQAKTSFLANMSHEIRTPLTAVLGYAELLEEPDLSTARRRQLTGVIRRSGQHLLSIINDILDITKIEAGGLRLESIECSPAKLVEEVCAWMRHRAEEKGLALTAEVSTPKTLPSRIRTDPMRLRQILVNLIGNAIKFSSRGQIVVHLAYYDVPSGGRLDFAVEDDGIGMTTEQISRIFEDFSQADSSTSRTFGGTGLGLAICRRLVTAMGGHIGASSRIGHGATFTFDLPVGPEQLLLSQRLPMTQRAAASASSAALSMLPPGLHILIADDSPDNQLLVSHFLTAAGARVSSVFNGDEAVKATVASVETNTPFSLILMDLQMPEMGGLDAVAAIRKAGVRIPVVALTASVFRDDQVHCLEAGCDGFLAKPVVRHALLKTIASLVGDRTDLPVPEVKGTAAPDPAPPPDRQAFDRAKLLLLVGGDVPLRSALLELAQTEIPLQLVALEAGVAAGDRRQIGARAHRLKGALASICAERATAQAALIEETAATGPPEALDRTLASLRGDVAELVAAIQHFRDNAPDARPHAPNDAVHVAS